MEESLSGIFLPGVLPKSLVLMFIQFVHSGKYQSSYNSVILMYNVYMYTIITCYSVGTEVATTF